MKKLRKRKKIKLSKKQRHFLEKHSYYLFGDDIRSKFKNQIRVLKRKGILDKKGRLIKNSNISKNGEWISEYADVNSLFNPPLDFY